MTLACKYMNVHCGYSRQSEVGSRFGRRRFFQIFGQLSAACGAQSGARREGWVAADDYMMCVTYYSPTRGFMIAFPRNSRERDCDFTSRQLFDTIFSSPSFLQVASQHYFAANLRLHVPNTPVHFELVRPCSSAAPTCFRISKASTGALPDLLRRFRFYTRYPMNDVASHVSDLASFESFSILTIQTC
jgi:hypothetical protein